MATVGPLVWPEAPKTDASTHHWVEDALQYELFSVPSQASMVVWTRSLVGLDMPGHKNSGPTFAIGGKRPGTIVVLAWMMRDVVGPKLQLAPQPSAAMAFAEGKAKIRNALKAMVRDFDMARSPPSPSSGQEVRPVGTNGSRISGASSAR